MKSAKRRPRIAKSRKSVTKTPAPKAGKNVKASPARRSAEKQPRLMIRFTDPADAAWLETMCARMRLGSAKGAGAATLVRMLIGAARECDDGGENPFDALRGVDMAPTVGGRLVRTIAPPPAEHPDYAQRVVDPPIAEDREPVDVDELVGRLADQAEVEPREQEEALGPGQVRVFGDRRRRDPREWSGR